MRINYAAESLVINESIEKVFNFVTRGAKYEKWHFDYHLKIERLDVREGGIGSAFSIEELIDGFFLRHVGRVTALERNKRFTWIARFALFSPFWIGTDWEFEKQGNATLCKETLFFEISPLLMPAALIFIWRPAFQPAACKAHVLDEMTGVKKMLENGDYDPEDVVYAYDDKKTVEQMKRYNYRIPERLSKVPAG